MIGLRRVNLTVIISSVLLDVVLGEMDEAGIVFLTAIRTPPPRVGLSLR